MNMNPSDLLAILLSKDIRILALEQEVVALRAKVAELEQILMPVPAE